MMKRRKLTPEEVWDSGKRSMGRPRKITEEEDRLLEQLAEILVDIYLDEKKIDRDIFFQEGLHTDDKA